MALTLVKEEDSFVETNQKTMFNFFSSKPKNYENLAAGPFHDLMTSTHSVVVDVRSAGEFSTGKLRGARNIDVMSPSFISQIKNLPKDKTYLLYCRSGSRSAQACEILAREGFQQIKNLEGGLMRWPFEKV